MKKTSKIWKFAAAAIPALILLGAGCSPSQTIGDKVAEKAAEKAIEKASGGKVDIDAKSGYVNIKGKDGTTMVVGGGADRPDSAPADLPTPAGAKNFTWIGSSGGGMLAYELAGSNYKQACANQIGLLAGVGWAKSDAYEMDIEGTQLKSMVKIGFTLTLTCGDNTEEGSGETKTSVTLNKATR